MTDIERFMKVDFEKINARDINNTDFIDSMIQLETYSIHLMDCDIDIDSVLKQVKESLYIYNDKDIIDKYTGIISNSKILFKNDFPFSFHCKIGIDTTGITTSFILPSVMDSLSYPFLADSIHHSLKDTNPNERKYRNKYADVIPMFSELVIADYQSEDKIKKELLSRIVNLLVIDKFNYSNIVIEHYNSFYYALLLYDMYKKDPIKVLDMVSKVLKHEINTYELLIDLGVYEGDNYTVKNELNEIKQYIR